MTSSASRMGISLLLLLAATATEGHARKRLSYGGAQDSRVRCAAHGAYEWFYEHQSQCAELGPIVCTLADSSRNWSCTPGTLQEYDVAATVEADETLSVRLTPRFPPIHPVPCVVLRFFLMFIACAGLRLLVPAHVVG